MSKNNIIYQSPPEDIAWKLQENDQNLVVESIQKCFHDAAKPLNINMALYGTSIMINLALPTKVANILIVKNLNKNFPERTATHGSCYSGINYLFFDRDDLSSYRRSWSCY